MIAKIAKLLLITYLIAPFVAANEAVAQDSKTRELWRGTFSQTSPLPWVGSMEVFIRFDEEDSFPQKIEGIISWGGLSNAKTKISGTRTSNGLKFRETECISGGCGSVVVGGDYKANFSSGGKVLKGSAALKTKNLKGQFKLKRVE